MKERKRINLNSYLFANLVIVSVLLIGLWNRKPVWDVSLRFPNLLLILVLLNTILIFREVILGKRTTPSRGRQKKQSRQKLRNLNELRVVLRNSPKIDENLLHRSLLRLREICGSDSVTLYILENGQCRQVAGAGELPAALNGSRFINREHSVFIKFPGSLGEEEIGKISAGNKPMSFKSALIRLELTALPLTLHQNKIGLCVFSSREAHKSPPIPLTSTALFLETLLALVENAGNTGDGRYKDKSTGLFLFECFADSFETEVERSERYKQEMSLLTISVRGFTKLDSDNAQQIARSAAAALKQSLRRLDLMFCGKNDGEFLAILTETGAEVAEIVAKRVQKTFAKQNEKFDFINSSELKMFIGSAAYPANATHGDGLLEKSRESLNQAINENVEFKAYGAINQ
ncbi:MAG: diguanylate cyclase [Candidatus Riflebacteria bacterium]|nr:diguanylate cyclase [Candidatus Riflebacteria bacterium]